MDCALQFLQVETPTRTQKAQRSNRKYITELESDESEIFNKSIKNSTPYEWKSAIDLPLNAELPEVPTEASIALLYEVLKEFGTAKFWMNEVREDKRSGLQDSGRKHKLYRSAMRTRLVDLEYVNMGKSSFVKKMKRNGINYTYDGVTSGEIQQFRDPRFKRSVCKPSSLRNCLAISTDEGSKLEDLIRYQG